MGFTFGGSGMKEGGGLGSRSTSLLPARFMRGTGAGLCRKGGAKVSDQRMVSNKICADKQFLL